jgi:PPM family protein phosphatase
MPEDKLDAPILKVRYCALTDRGRVRDNNEDAFVIDEAMGLAVLADGMGGYNAGEVASAMAVSLTQQSMQAWKEQHPGAATADDLGAALQNSVSHANAAIWQASRDSVDYAGMGTTLVLALLQDDMIFMGHVGDSRGYRLRAGQLAALTRDHSVLQEQLDAGLITPQQAITSPHRNLVTRAMGVEPEVHLEVQQEWVQPGDLYLLCSDGLTDMVDNMAIERSLTQPQELVLKAHALVKAANAGGGRDNISVVLIEIQTLPVSSGSKA